MKKNSPPIYPLLLRDVFTGLSLFYILIIAVVPPLIYSTQVGLDQGWQAVRLPLLGESFAYSFVFTASLYYGCKSIMALLNLRMPWKDNVSRRLLTEVFSILAYASMVQIFIIYVFHQIGIHEDPKSLNARNLFDSVLFGNAITIIVVAFFEGQYFFQAWRDSLIQAERIKKENLQNQLLQLRTQLDPHFLFNSLNVLSCLIRKDPTKAEHFVDDFARVYRYLLEVKNEIVVPLKEELRFAEHYLNLQKIRFEAGLQTSIHINPEHLQRYVPPLSLQELVSNAIKHNRIDAQYPLQLELRSHGDNLLVRNNLQMRREKIDSTGLGLQNLRERYHLLNAKKSPTFCIENGYYQALLPLLRLEEEVEE